MENVYGLLGEKLGHSFSPKIHSYIMKNIGIKGTYSLFEVDMKSLNSAFMDFKSHGAKGLNVTIPYKTKIMQYLDEISNEAKKIGAVNTIAFNNGKAKGFNTDYYGFGIMIDKFNIPIKNINALILGTGGVSGAVTQYLLDNGINKITFAARNIIKAKDKYTDFEVIEYGNIKKLKDYTLIINCTPCGMYPDVQKCPVSNDILKNFSHAVDLIYNPAETLFLKNARDMNLETVNGLYMLIGQAVKAQEIWNNIKIENRLVDEIYNFLLAE